MADPTAVVRYAAIDDRHQIKLAGPATENMPFAIASVGKTMTAVAVLKLAEDGLINLEAEASKYLPKRTVQGLGGMSGISVAHLLTMTSGLPDYYDDDYLQDALDQPAETQKATIALSYAYDLPASFAPGSDFEYSNTNYVLLGLIIEAVAKKPYHAVLAQRVFAPAGMEGSFVFGSRALPENFPDGHSNDSHVRDYYQGQGFGDGGIISTAVDLVRFYQALFQHVRLLDANSLDLMLHDPIGEGYGMGIDLEESIIGHAGGDLGFSSDIGVDSGRGQDRITRLSGFVFSTCVRL